MIVDRIKITLFEHLLRVKQEHIGSPTIYLTPNDYHELIASVLPLGRQEGNPDVQFYHVNTITSTVGSPMLTCVYWNPSIDQALTVSVQAHNEPSQIIYLHNHFNQLVAILI